MKRILLSLLFVFTAVAAMAQTSTNKFFPTTYNFQRGYDEYQQGNNETALDYFTKDIAENPKNGHSYLYAAYAYISIAEQSDEEEPYGDYISMINDALKYLPKKDVESRSFAYQTLSNISLEMGDTVKAMKEINSAISTNKDDLDAISFRAHIYYLQKNYDLSNADYNTVMSRDASKADAYWGLGRNALATEDYPQAEKFFTKTLTVDPDYVKALISRCCCYIFERKYREAAIDCVSAIEKTNHSTIALNTMSWIADSSFVNMEAQLRVKAKQDKDNGIWPYYIATLNENAGRYKEAIKYFQQSQNTYGTTDPVLMRGIAECYQRIYNYPKALQYVNLAMSSASNYGSDEAAYDSIAAYDSTEVDYSAGADLTSYYVIRNSILYSLDREAEALADCDSLIECVPDNYFAYANRGHLRYLYGDNDGAIADFATASALCGEGEEPSYINMYRGSALLKAGKTADAQRCYEAIVKADTVVGEHDEHVKFAHAYLGHKTEAYALMDSTLAKAEPYELPGEYYNAACVYAICGDTDRALDYLEKALEGGWRDLVHLSYDTDVDNLRSLPRFRALVEKYVKIYEQELNEQNAETVSSETASIEPVEMVTDEVAFLRESGIYKVKCSINGLPLHFYFDTGAADVTISSVEAAFMLKNGYLKRSDIAGKAYYGNASGDIAEGTVITLRKVEFGGMTLNNVKASVVHSQNAPLLLGQTVLSRLGRIEIDNEKKLLRITHPKKK